MKNIKTIVLGIFFLFGLFSCLDESDQISRAKFEGGVFIMNEGAFGSNDGEVYYYSPNSGEIKSNIFEATNGRPFAGLIQDLVLSEEKLYLVANTGKVEIVDPIDFSSIGTVIDGLDITRSLVTANQKIFISDWGPYDDNFNSPNSYIAVVNNLNGGIISKKIQVSSRPEKMFVSDNKIFVGTTSGKKLEVISLDAESVIFSKDVEGVPDGFFELGGNLYLYAYDEANVYFHLLDRISGNIENTYTLPLKNATSKFILTEGGEMLIITSTGWPDYKDAIARVSLSNRQVITESLYTGSGFYGIGYHPELKEIYVGDNNGFQGNGTVIVLDQNGQQLKTIAVGRGPSGFLVK
ncbi:YncE family protein [Shivajiella indica]|uniref:DUF5074 domain-containing protein n=1 Tax=Shivajiella indica TaxID=872115 RepID=A0ABW5BFK0_9BACT